MESQNTCPAGHPTHSVAARANRDWWPNQLDLGVLHRNPPAGDPYGVEFDYRAAFAALDLDAVKADIATILTTSQEWWPADYGNYGPLFIRLAWHAAGTYRISDGRGGAGSGDQRFAPLNSWPDNANLDKARRLLWPVKQKYGRALSWADLMVLVGNVALEAMGFATFGFGGGRADVWEPTEVNWGTEDTWLDDRRYQGERQLDNPLAAVQMGLIYVNPEGPGGNPDALAAAQDIRETFRRMAMNDEETVALIAGGHTFGKAHGAAPATNVGPEPEAARLEEMGLGWSNSHGSGRGGDTITSGLEGAWTPTPVSWDNSFFETLFSFEWEQVHSPAGAIQWRPTDPAAGSLVPDAHDPQRRHAPMMLTTDLALRVDPAYEAIARRFHANPQEFADAFAKAWFKLTHRDMGPLSRYLGPLVPREPQVWQDPVPAVSHPLVGPAEIAVLKEKILASGVSVADLVTTAWAAASTFRATDKRGGANGGRIRLAPQNQWEVNDPARLSRVLDALTAVATEFNASAAQRAALPRAEQAQRARISVADIIVLGGVAAVEKAARDAGFDVDVPFSPGRTDAGQDDTDIESFAVLEPIADGFRNYLGKGTSRPAEQLLVDRAELLGLTAPEMTVLVGGLRVLGATVADDRHGVFTANPGVLSTDFFATVVDPALVWTATSDAEETFVGRDRSGAPRYSATRVDLVFGSNSQLRALAEVYASADASEKFVRDFVAAWHKVMNADRFDLD